MKDMRQCPACTLYTDAAKSDHCRWCGTTFATAADMAAGQHAEAEEAYWADLRRRMCPDPCEPVDVAGALAAHTVPALDKIAGR